MATAATCITRWGSWRWTLWGRRFLARNVGHEAQTIGEEVAAVMERFFTAGGAFVSVAG